MGVDRRDYVIYGYKMPLEYLESKGINILEDAKFLPLIEGWKGEDYCIIYDWMNGRYCVFGVCISKAGHHGFDFIELPVERWPIHSQQVSAKFKDLFGISAEDLGAPKVLLFTHFS